MTEKASARRADRVSATLLLLFSLFVIREARALPYWTANAPGPGFVPFWLGVLLVCASIGLCARTFVGGPRGGECWLPDRAATRRVATLVGLTAASAGLSLVLGLVLASGVFMAATLTYLRPAQARANCAAAILAPIVVWLLFVRWLAVPLPAGPLGF